jgi:hypothetical protein
MDVKFHSCQIHDISWAEKCLYWNAPCLVTRLLLLCSFPTEQGLEQRRGHILSCTVNEMEPMAGTSTLSGEAGRLCYGPCEA